MEQVQKSFNGEVGMGCTMRQIVETRKSPSIKDTSTIMCNPSLHISGKGVTHDFASILGRRGFPCFHNYLHGASHPYTSPLNDFCTSIHSACLQNNALTEAACCLQTSYVDVMLGVYHFAVTTYIGCLVTYTKNPVM